MNLKELADVTAQKYGIPVSIFQALITLESAWDPDARGISGAIGLTQVMPDTAKSMGFDPVRLARDPVMQLKAGAKYLSKMYDLFNNWEHALAAYNAGPHNVRKHKGIPPFKETRNYVRRVSTLASSYERNKEKSDDITLA